MRRAEREVEVREPIKKVSLNNNVEKRWSVKKVISNLSGGREMKMKQEKKEKEQLEME